MLELKSVSQRYEQKQVLQNVSLTLGDGEIGCLLGPSGCGKTTLLRLIAGFQSLESGEIKLANTLVSHPGHSLPPDKRQVGVVFQDYALFPHLSVAENIRFGLHTLSGPARNERVAQMLALVGLEGEAARYPHQLSGGQQQRVALARALAPKPRLLLLDEPLSNLDTELREKLALELRDILKQESITALLVTHDQHEAFALADRIGVLHQGVIQQWDSAFGLYHTPVNRFVANFIGQGALLPGQLITTNSLRTELGILEGFSSPAFCLQQECHSGTRVEVLLRPGDIEIESNTPFRATISRVLFRGDEYLYTLTLDSGNEVLALAGSHTRHQPGDQVCLRLKADHVIAFPIDAGVQLT